jgi:hypothetical protein
MRVAERKARPRRLIRVEVRGSLRMLNGRMIPGRIKTFLME